MFLTNYSFLRVDCHPQQLLQKVNWTSPAALLNCTTRERGGGGGGEIYSHVQALLLLRFGQLQVSIICTLHTAPACLLED